MDEFRPHPYDIRCGCDRCEADDTPALSDIIDAAEWTLGDMPQSYFALLDVALYEAGDGMTPALVERLAELAKQRRAVIEKRLEAVAERRDAA